jgi:integrase
LRGYFRYLFGFGRMNQAGASTLLSLRQYRPARLARALTPEQVPRLLRSMESARYRGKRDFSMILIAASLGVWASEVTELKPQDLEWTQAVVSFQPIKGKSILHMPHSSPLIEALADYLKNERPNDGSHRNIFWHLPLLSGSAVGVPRLPLSQEECTTRETKESAISFVMRLPVSCSEVSESTFQHHEVSGEGYWNAWYVYIPFSL